MTSQEAITPASHHKPGQSRVVLNDPEGSIDITVPLGFSKESSKNIRKPPVLKKLTQKFSGKNKATI